MKEVIVQSLGQAGYLVESDGLRIAIDPYLSDSCGVADARFSRLFPPPIAPADLEVDIMIITHNHTDHLDPETIGPYRHKATTRFVAPRLTASALAATGVPEGNISVVDHAGTLSLPGVTITGVFALGTSPDSVDTCGYLLAFPTGQTLYTCSDTSWCDLLAQCAPKAVDVLLVCINGHFGNLNVDQALLLTKAVQPRIVVPNHYDVMALNSENPETFRLLYDQSGLSGQCVILAAGESLAIGK